MSRILYSKDYNAKKGLKDPSNAEHYVIVDAGSGAEKQYTDKGWGDADGAPKTLQEAEAQDAKSPEELLSEHTQAAEDKLADEHAQRVAAEAKALAAGGVSATPNDQSKADPVTETAGSEVIKSAVAEQATPTPVSDAVSTAIADKVKEGVAVDASFDKTTKDAEAEKAKAADATKTAEVEKAKAEPKK